MSPIENNGYDESNDSKCKSPDDSKEFSKYLRANKSSMQFCKTRNSGERLKESLSYSGVTPFNKVNHKK